MGDREGKKNKQKEVLFGLKGRKKGSEMVR
jgi:hypothetical protein